MNLYECLSRIIPVDDNELYPRYFSDEERGYIDTEEEKATFDLLRNVASLGVKIRTDGIEFHPMMIFEGRRTFSVEDLSEEDYELLMTLDWSQLPLNLKCRVTDILWTVKKDFRAALSAAKAYFDLYKLFFSEENWVDTLDYVKRAICISKQINNKELFEKVCKELYDKVILLNGSDKGFLSLRMIDIILNYRYGDLTKILCVIDNIIKNNPSNISKTEQAYEYRADCLNKLKRGSEAQNSNIQLAEYYVDMAECIQKRDVQGAFRSEHLFRKAIMLFRNNGNSQRAEEVHRRLVEIQKEIPKMMVPVSMEFDVSELVSNIEQNFKNLSFEEAIVRMTQTITFYKKDDLREEVIRDINEHPLANLFGKSIINDTGQTVVSLPSLDISDLEENDDVLELYIFQKLLDHGRWAGDLYLKFVYQYICKNYSFTEKDFSFLTDNNVIVPEGRERIFCSAFALFLNGHCYEAMHILAPQVENLFRNIAKEVGGLTVTLESDGSSKEKVLSSVFDLPELLDCYDNDIIFLFKGLLNEQAGANIRNEIAHGIASERNACSGIYLFFAGAVMKLISYTSPKWYEVYRNSEKLKSFVQPSENAVKIKNL